ncbi:MAG: hypothetical protein DRQ55_07450 [Planctomycetota bacterium]|nr:MAG: hypothetical protein DRQ55_07450 [Planctomycetota bacterium]
MVSLGPAAVLALCAPLMHACMGELPAELPAELAAPGSLLVLDADAGEAQDDGERRGVVFVAAPDGQGGWEAPTLLATDVRWLEPVALVTLSDRSLLVVESRWPHDRADAAPETPGRGALFRIAPGAPGGVELWWSDPRLRRPIAAVLAPDGTLYVSDRDADPLGLGAPTGAVFALRPGPDGGRPSEPARIAAAGPELVTPGPLLALPDGRVLLMDADRNPLGLDLPSGIPRTAGELYELRDGALISRAQPTLTVSPIGMLLRAPHDLFIIDANAGDRPPHLGDGAVFRLDTSDLGGPLHTVVSSTTLGRRHALADPAGGDVLPDGRLLIVDANLDPLHLGPDGTGKGVYGTGPGAVMWLDPEQQTLALALASERFVMPLDVHVVRP